MPELYTVREAAGILRVSVSKLYKMREAGEIQFVPVGGTNKVLKDDILSLIDAKTGKRIRERK